MSGKNIAIRASKLQKVFRLYKSPFDAFKEFFTGKIKHTKSIVLDDINLEVCRGEIVGILGRNGAGKSTLLKLIAGTLTHTSGELEVNGRITAILELGTGFHPEYTGRENIYMGGLCLGMSRREIDSKIDSIIDFSELRDVIDHRFKTYSTGMQARLTFSTAISVDPDILIVDEALAVGDARFQMKCFAWLQKLRSKNTTVLLVSHDINTITTICDRAIILEEGRVFDEGDSRQITSRYHNLLFGKKDEKPINDNSDDAEPLLPVIKTTSKIKVQKRIENKDYLRYGSKEAEIVNWGITDKQGNPIVVIESGTPFKMHMTFESRVDIPALSYGFAIKDKRGTVLWGITNMSQDLNSLSVVSGQISTVVLDGVMWLAEGNYFVNFGLAHLSNGEKIDFFEDGIEFKVTGPTGIFTTSAVNLQSLMTIEHPISQNLKVQK
jgi:lipopolysaccharide transport system ATP-binding protein